MGSFSERDRMKLRTIALRDRAETLLTCLINAQRAIDRHEPPPVCSRIRSRDGMNRAIAAAKQFIAALNVELADSALDALDEEVDLILRETEVTSGPDSRPLSEPLSSVPAAERASRLLRNSLIARTHRQAARRSSSTGTGSP